MGLTFSYYKKWLFWVAYITPFSFFGTQSHRNGDSDLSYALKIRTQNNGWGDDQNILRFYQSELQLSNFKLEHSSG